MKFVSLFAGAGGFDLGLEAAGHECIGQCEIEPTARAVLERHWPHVPKHDDVTTIQHDTFPHPELVTFGSPCQDLSVAGKRAGMVDGETRSGLFYEAVRYIREIQEATDGLLPRCALWENVPGAYSSNGGEDFATVLALLVGGDVRTPPTGWPNAGVAFGPLGSAEWRTLDSQYFGVAQRRRRVFLVYRPGGERAGEVLLEPDGMQRDPPQSRTPGQGITGSLTGGPSSSSAGNVDDNRAQAGFVIPVAFMASDYEQGTFEQVDLARPITTSADRTRAAPIAFALRGRDDGAMPEISGDRTNALRGSEGGSSRDYVAFAQNQRDEVRDLNDLASALAAEPGMKQQTYVAFDLAQITSATNRTRAEPDRPMSTLAANSDPHVAYYESGPGWFSEGVGTLRAEGENRPSRPAHVIHAPSTYAVRRLTPRECARLQGFPDDHTRYHPDGREIADTHRYRLMGNAVTTNVITWIGRRLPA